MSLRAASGLIAMGRRAPLGGSLTRDDNLSMSGRFIVTATSSMDGGICVGYVNTSSDNPFGFQDAGVTGFQIVEPNPGGRVPLATMMRSLELLGKEVAPALR